MSPDATPIPTQVTHLIGRHDLDAWLAEHGLTADDVRDATIDVARRGTMPDVCAWLNVTFFKRDARGSKYTADGETVATGAASIPLRSFPRLTPLEER